MSFDSTRIRNRTFVLDTFALSFCVALFAYFIYSVKRGIGVVDESFYYTIVQRLIQGDRLLIDDWHVSQLSSVLQILPYKLFTIITGSTDGVLLFMRYVYLFCCFCIYWFLYLKMRKYGVWGLSSALFFSAFVFVFKTLCYTTMSMQGMAVFCALMFTNDKKKSTPTLLLSGIVFSCAVLAEPILVLAYIIYCIMVFANYLYGKKSSSKPRYEFALNARNWSVTTAGILICFCIFMFYIQIKCGVTKIIRIVPELFTDSEYDLLHLNLFVHALKREFAFSVELNGKWTIIGLLVTWLLTCVYVWYTNHISATEKKQSPKTTFIKSKQIQIMSKCKFALVSVTCALTICAYVHEFVLFFSNMSSITGLIALCPLMPTLLFGFCCFNLCKNKNPQLFCFIFVAAIYSVLVDCASDMVALPGSQIALLGTIPHFGILWREIKDEGKELLKKCRTNKKNIILRSRVLIGRIVMVFCGVLFCSWTLVFLMNIVSIGMVEKLYYYDDQDAPLNAVLESGVYKGIHTTEKVKQNYEDLLEDMDTIKKNCNGPLYIADLAAMPYLYADLPYGTYSAWFVDGDWETRLIRYWQIFPSRLPEYIYLPYSWYECQDFPERKQQIQLEKLSFFKNFCTCEEENGKTGDIVHVLSWDLEKIKLYSPLQTQK